MWETIKTQFKLATGYNEKVYFKIILLVSTILLLIEVNLKD